MKEDWPHLEILSNNQGLLGTDSRLKLIEAALFDVRRRFEELNDLFASAGERLHLVQGNLKQQEQTCPNFSRFLVKGKQFPLPPANDAFHEDVVFLRHSVEKEGMKRDQEIISVQRQLNGLRDSYKQLTESQRVQQSALESCLLRLENCENMRDSIQMLTSSKLEIRQHLEEVQHSVQNCLVKQRTWSEADAGSNAINGPKPAVGVNPLLFGHIAKLSRDVAGVTERLTSLELRMQGSAFARQDSSTSGKTVVNDIHRMQLSIATANRSLRKRPSDLTSCSSTASSLSSILMQRSVSGQRPSIPKFHASSAAGIDRFPEKSPPAQSSPCPPSLNIRFPAIRLPHTRPSGTCSRPDSAPDNEDIASDASTSTQCMSPLNTNSDTLDTLRTSTARGALSAVPKDARTATARTFQDAAFQNVMADVLQKTDVSAATGCIPDDSKSADKSASRAMKVDDAAGVEDVLQKFLHVFDKAVGSDVDFEQNLTSMIDSMQSSDLTCEPMQQILETLEKWLKSKTGLSAVHQVRYDSQLRLYKQVLSICKSNPDPPLPDAARGEVRQLLEELHKLGQLPDGVMNEMTPKDAGEGGESFEDFIQSMGLNSNLGAAEQDLLKKLTENPDELNKVMKDMAEGMPEEPNKVMKEGLPDEWADACKQQ